MRKVQSKERNERCQRSVNEGQRRKNKIGDDRILSEVRDKDVQNNGIEEIKK